LIPPWPTAYARQLQGNHRDDRGDATSFRRGKDGSAATKNCIGPLLAMKPTSVIASNDSCGERAFCAPFVRNQLIPVTRRPLPLPHAVADGGAPTLVVERGRDPWAGADGSTRLDPGLLPSHGRPEGSRSWLGRHYRRFTGRLGLERGRAPRLQPRDREELGPWPWGSASSTHPGDAWSGTPAPTRPNVHKLGDRNGRAPSGQLRQPGAGCPVYSQIGSSRGPRPGLRTKRHGLTAMSLRLRGWARARKSCAAMTAQGRSGGRRCADPGRLAYEALNNIGTTGTAWWSCVKRPNGRSYAPNRVSLSHCRPRMTARQKGWGWRPSLGKALGPALRGPVGGRSRTVAAMGGWARGVRVAIARGRGAWAPRPHTKGRGLRSRPRTTRDKCLHDIGPVRPATG